jgi:hypothetical protein
VDYAGGGNDLINKFKEIIGRHRRAEARRNEHMRPSPELSELVFDKEIGDCAWVIL